MTQYWWCYPASTERVYAGLHWSQWHIGASLNLWSSQLAIYIGPLTFGVSWWAKA